MDTSERMEGGFLRLLRLGPWERKIIASLIKNGGKAKWSDIKKEHSGHSKLNKNAMTPTEYERIKKIHGSLYKALKTLESTRKLKKGYIVINKNNKQQIDEIILPHSGIRELHERKLITDEDLKTLE